MASIPVPRIIVLAIGAGALGFPNALKYLLLEIAGRRPVTDVAICVFAVAVVTAQALGAVLLARFVRKARAGGDDASPPRTDRFAQVTLVLSLAVSFLVSACLLVASGAGARGLAREVKSPVIAVLAAVLPWATARPLLLRIFRRAEDHSHGAAAAAAASTTGTGRFRFASMARRVATFTGAGAAAFLLLAESGGIYTRRGSLVGVAAAVVGTVLLARFAFTPRAHNAARAGGRARLAPFLAVVSFVALTHGCAARELA